MPLMVSSFFAQTVHLNNLESMQDCVMESKDVLVHAEKIVQGIMSGEADDDDSWTEAIKAAGALANAVDGCVGSPNEIKMLKKWLVNRASTKQKMVDSASWNSQQGKHSVEMNNAVVELWSVINDHGGDAILFGVALAKTAYWSLGPVKDADVVYGEPSLLNL